MKFKLGPLKERQFNWKWFKERRVLLIGLYWFVLGIDFRSKLVKVSTGEAPLAEKKVSAGKASWYSKKCKVCGLALLVNNNNQVIYYHRPCRRLRYRILDKSRLDLLRGYVLSRYNV